MRLARRSDGRAVGVVVDGQPSAERPTTPVRWLVPVDVDSGAVGEPEPQGASDFADRDAISLCIGDEVGWVLDVPWTQPVHVSTGPRASESLRNGYARIRVSRDRLCVERMAGVIDGPIETGGRTVRGTLPQGEAASVDLAAFLGRSRVALRCVRR